MVLPTITGLYAGFAGLMLLVLSLRVIRVRRVRSLSLGDGGDQDLARRIRAHGNFCEYVPLALILIGSVEAVTYPDWVVHILGITLLTGRIVHAWSISAQSILARVAGMSLTFFVLATGSLLAIAAYARH